MQTCNPQRSRYNAYTETQREQEEWNSFTEMLTHLMTVDTPVVDRVTTRQSFLTVR